MKNKVYDFLKYLSITGLPVLEIAIPQLFAIWNIPYGEEIGKTLDVLAVTLAGLLMISIANYNGKSEQEEKDEEGV